MSDDIERATEPKRLGGDLIASARTDAPSAAARARIAGTLGLGIGAAAATTKAAAATATATKAAATTTTAAKIAGLGVWTKVISVAAITIAAGSAAVVASRSDPPMPAETAQARTSTRAIGTPSYDSARARHDEIPLPEPIPSVQAASAGVSSGADPTTRESARAAQPSATAAAGVDKSTDPPPAAPSPLTREVRAIDSARTALASGDARTALAALDAHDREFPNGPMKTEADVLRVDALDASGDHAAASRLASALLARDPSGAHARHLRAVIGK